MNCKSRILAFCLSCFFLGGFALHARAAAEPVSFEGNWMATTNDARYVMALKQVGSTVIGTFTPNNGKLEGKVLDNILSFKWTTGGGTGSGRFVMDREEMEFHGTYSLGDDPGKAEGFWFGTRTPSFAGTWKVDSAPTPLIFKLKQSAYRVTGEFSKEGVANDPVVSVRAGVAARDTLRFVATDAAGKILGDAEWTLDDGGKSFKGTLTGKPVTGVFVEADG